MYSALGYGKGDTILAAAAIVLGCPACVKTANCSHMFNLYAQTMAPLVLWQADTKCQPVCSQKQPLGLSTPLMLKAVQDNKI